MFSQKIHSSGWAIWLQWVLLSMSGWFAVTILSMRLPINLDETLPPAAFTIIWALMLLALGAVIAAVQWLLLRGYFSGAVRWIIFSGMGMMVGQMVAFPLKLRDLYVGTSGFQLDEIAYGAVLGILLGFAQWLVMRTWMRRAWLWVVGSTIGWTLGMTVGEFLPLNWNSSSASIFYGTITTAIPIALTGVVLVMLLPQPTEDT